MILYNVHRLCMVPLNWECRILESIPYFTWDILYRKTSLNTILVNNQLLKFSFLIFSHCPFLTQNVIFTSYLDHKVQLATYKHEYNPEIGHFASYSYLLFLLQFIFEMELTNMIGIPHSWLKIACIGSDPDYAGNNKAAISNRKHWLSNMIAALY